MKVEKQPSQPIKYNYVFTFTDDEIKDIERGLSGIFISGVAADFRAEIRNLCTRA